MPGIELWSADRRFGVFVQEAIVAQLLKECQLAKSRETGGILIGVYSDRRDRAIVERVTGPTRDSKSGPTWFHRGVLGLQRLLDELWNRGQGYYLGEWHFHPQASPHASETDHTSLRGIAHSDRYNCPEPVLLIIGGDPRGDWRASALVFPRNGKAVSLLSPGKR
jgi:integrative and conjugative element protein (TIGR02256 family)